MVSASRESGRSMIGEADSIVQSHHDSSGELLSLLASDVDTARAQLSASGLDHKNSLGALSSLSKVSAAVWLECIGGPELQEDMAKDGYFVFEDRASEFAEVFVSSLAKGEPLMLPAPDQVVDLLRNAQPGQIHERGMSPRLLNSIH